MNQIRQAEVNSSVIKPTETRRNIFIVPDKLISILIILPALIAVGVFVYGFIAWTGFVSLTQWHGINPDYTLIGLGNYGKIFSTSRFQTDFRNNLVFTLFFLVSCLGIGLVLALILNARIKGENIFRAIFLFPMALSFVVTGTAWRWLFTPGEAGTPTGLNLLLKNFGINVYQDWSISSKVVPGWQPDWLHTQIGVPLAIFPVVIAAVWQMSGFTVAMYLAGLRGIPEDLYQAAEVDGASSLQAFRYVTLPMLRPVTLSAVIVLGHISLKIFDLILTQTGGGPGNATEVPGIFAYQYIFTSNKYGEGSAASIVMLLLVATLMVPYLRNSFRNARLEEE